MNEFTNKKLSELKQFKINMESYKEGSLDTIKILQDFIKELYEKTQIQWNSKIMDCQEEIDRQENLPK